MVGAVLGDGRGMVGAALKIGPRLVGEAGIVPATPLYRAIACFHRGLVRSPDCDLLGPAPYCPGQVAAGAEMASVPTG